MEINSRNVLETTIEKAEKMVEEAISQLIQVGCKIESDLRTEYLPLLQDLVKNLTGEMKGIAFGKEVDILDMPTFVDFAKKYIVPTSNEIVAIKVKQDECFFIYIAYSKDRQLIPTSDNKYVIIKARSLDRQVEDLFNESDLIILK